MLNAASRDIILLQEILSYLGESLEGMEVPERPEDEAGGTLYKVQCSTQKIDLQPFKSPHPSQSVSRGRQRRTR